MANESKRYAQRGTKVGEKTKLTYNPTALRDEPTVSRNKSLSFREDLSPKTSTGGSGGSNLIPRNKVDMASGNRNIGSQASNAKNIVPRGISGPGAGKSEAFIRGANDALYKGSMGATTQLASDLLNSPKIKQNRDEVTRRAIAKASKPKGYEIPEDFGMKNPSEGWEDKKEVSKTPAPKAAIKSAPKGESQSSKDSRMAAYEEWVKTTRDPSTKGYLKTSFESKTPAADSGVQSRIDDNASFFKARQLASDNPGMKKGGKVAAKPMKAFAKGGSIRSASSRGDGCATKGHTRGAMR
jgi:hypothetical protein